MNHKQRQLAAIRHETPDRIPVDAQAVENRDAVARLLGIPECAVGDTLGLDGACIGLGYAGSVGRDPDGNPLTEWGTPRYLDWGSTHVYPLMEAETVSAVERFPWPDPRVYDFAGARNLASSVSKEYAVRGPRFSALTDPVFLLMGQEEALTKMVLNPAVFEAMLDRVFQVTLAASRQYIATLGEHLDCYCLWEDFATQRGMMFSPELWRRFFKPRYARLFEAAKSAGKYVWFHSCGDITAIMPDLLDIGMDVWETVQLHTLPIPPERLKRDFGKHLTFFGGVNTQRLPFMTPTEVTAEVERCVRLLGKGGGYICGPDHHVKPDVSPDNTVALFRAAREFREPEYTQDKRHFEPEGPGYGSQARRT